MLFLVVLLILDLPATLLFCQGPCSLTVVRCPRGHTGHTLVGTNTGQLDLGKYNIGNLQSPGNKKYTRKLCFLTLILWCVLRFGVFVCGALLYCLRIRQERLVCDLVGEEDSSTVTPGNRKIVTGGDSAGVIFRIIIQNLLLFVSGKPQYKKKRPPPPCIS